MLSVLQRLKGHADRARAVLLPLAAAAAITVLAVAVHRHYPIHRWLFWLYARAWLWCGLFTLGCLSLGNLVTGALLRPSVGLRERLLFSLATGVLAFFYLLFAAGLLGLYGRAFAVAAPVLAIAAGARQLHRRGRRVFRHLRAARRRRPPAALGPLSFAALVFGLAGIGMVYFSILSPTNIAFDSQFYHLGLAQQYAVEGAIRRDAVGWMPAAIPHLASVLYTWCFLLPGAGMFERIVCAAHLEMVLFLLTLASVPLLVRRLVPGARAGLSWVAVFLFPGILLYDSNLSVAADHVAAFWAVPAYLALLLALRSLDPRAMVLLAAMLSGALLTKYQALYLLAFPALAVVARAATLLFRRLRGRSGADEGATPLLGLGAVIVAGLVLTSPHWLKNWVWYGDPLFPNLHRVFKPAAWEPDLGRHYDLWSTWQGKSWTPAGSTGQRLRDTFGALFTFSFVPHDWKTFHGKVPVFGSLFTLSMLLLVFLRRTRRTWALVLATHIGVFLWYWTLHQDRYLQLLLPWMAAVVAATLHLAWRAGIAARVLTSALVGLQIVWGGDVYFMHARSEGGPAAALKLLGEARSGKYDERLAMPGALFELGRAKELPADARVLLHEHNPRLGLWRPVIGDMAGWQFGLRYDLAEGPAEVDAALRKLGVTHIVSRPNKSRRTDSLGADLRFFDYLARDAGRVKAWREFVLYRLPASPPTYRPNDVVAYLGCGKVYQPGLHPMRALTVRDGQDQKAKLVKAATPLPAGAGGPAAVIAKAGFAVTGTKCKPAVESGVLAGFDKIATRGDEELWSRKRAPAASSSR